MAERQLRQIRTCCLIFLALLSGCAPSPEPVVLQGQTMGTTWLVRAHAVTNPVAMQAEIETLLQQINASMSTYLPDSELNQLNNAPAGCHAVSEGLYAVVAEALNIHAASGGSFDVTVGPLVDLWGFGAAGRSGKVPAQTEINRLRNAVGSQYLDVRERQVCKQRDDIRIDLSAIAKGYAVDEIADLLSAAGISNFLVEIGGELRVSGYRQKDEPWRIAVELPDPESRSVYQILELTGAAVATSGEYRNFFDYGGKRYSHTLDPRSGWPVEHHPGSVTVIHDSAMRADALATALNVMGAEQGIEWASARELKVLYLVAKEEGDAANADDFQSLATPAFTAYSGGIH